MLFFICKDVLKSHLEALKIFLAAARYRYIKSIHFTNENDWYTSKKLSALDNKTQLKSLFKSSLQEFHWKGRFLGNSVVGILGKGRIGDGECWLQKRSTIWELWVKFYLGQNEDYSLGDSISDSSKKQLQRGRQKINITYDSSEVGTCSQVHILTEAHCSLQGIDVTVNDFSAFSRYEEMQKLGSWNLKISNYRGRPVLPFFSEHRVPPSFLISTLKSLQRMLKISSSRSSWFNPCRSRWQVPICSWKNRKSYLCRRHPKYFI